MNKNWSIIIKFHDCPHAYPDGGYRYCAFEYGPTYCNESECPIKQPLDNGNATEVKAAAQPITALLRTSRRAG